MGTATFRSASDIFLCVGDTFALVLSKSLPFSRRYPGRLTFLFHMIKCFVPISELSVYLVSVLLLGFQHGGFAENHQISYQIR